jgi:hypothetical protein
MHPAQSFTVSTLCFTLMRYDNPVMVQGYIWTRSGGRSGDWSRAHYANSLIPPKEVKCFAYLVSGGRSQSFNTVDI